MKKIKQAFAISKQHKDYAVAFYAEAVAVVANKNYKERSADAHADMNIEFADRWLRMELLKGRYELDEICAEANVAFNYANFTKGIYDKFYALAKELVDENERVNDNELTLMAKQMNFVLLATTADSFVSRN